MGTCIQCDKDALKESDFCAECEAREFKKIRGWLFVPAISLVLSLLTIVVSINTTVQELMENDGAFVAGLLYTSPRPRDGLLARMPTSA